MDLSNLVNGLTGAAGATGQDPMKALAGVQAAIDEHGGVDGLLQRLRAGGSGRSSIRGSAPVPTSRSSRNSSVRRSGRTR